MSWLVALPIILPLLAAAFAALAWGAPRQQQVIALVSGLLQVPLAIALYQTVDQFGPILLQMGAWPAPHGVGVLADSLGAGLCVIVAVVFLLLMAQLCFWPGGQAPAAPILPLLLILQAGSAATFLTGDIFNLYVWFEISLMTALALLALSVPRDRLVKVLFYGVLNWLGTAIFLLGVGLLYGLTGTLNFTDLASRLQPLWLTDAALMHTAMAMILLGLFLKAAIFPLFFWLPFSYVWLPWPMLGVFAAVLTKLGLYAIMRLSSFLWPFVPWLPELFTALGFITVLLASLGVVAERELVRQLVWLVALGTGMTLLAFGVGDTTAALSYMTQDMLSKAALFLLVGLAFAAGAGRLAASWHPPAVALAFALTIGLPPSPAFWSKLQILQSVTPHALFVSLLLVSSGLLLLYALVRSWQSLLLEELRAPGLQVLELRAVWPAAILLLLLLWLGLAPQLWLDFCANAAQGLSNPSRYHQMMRG